MPLARTVLFARAEFNVSGKKKTRKARQKQEKQEKKRKREKEKKRRREEGMGCVYEN